MWRGTPDSCGSLLFPLLRIRALLRIVDRDRFRRSSPGPPATLHGGASRPRRPEADPSDGAAKEAGLDSMAVSQPSPKSTTFDPVRGAATTVGVPVFGRHSDVVPHPDLPGQLHVPVRQEVGPGPCLDFRQREQDPDPLVGHADHLAGASPLATSPRPGWAAPHTGHRTATEDIMVLQVGQWTARPTHCGGIQSGGAAPGGEGTGVAGPPAAGPGGGGATGTIGGPSGAPAGLSKVTVAPHRRQKRVPSSAGAWQRGQWSTNR